MLRKLEENEEKHRGDHEREERERMIVIDKNSEGSEQHPASTLRNLPLIIRRSTFSAIPKA